MATNKAQTVKKLKGRLAGKRAVKKTDQAIGEQLRLSIIIKAGRDLFGYHLFDRRDVVFGSTSVIPRCLRFFRLAPDNGLIADIAVGRFGAIKVIKGQLLPSIEQSMQQPEAAHKGHSTRMRFSGILFAERTGFPARTER